MLSRCIVKRGAASVSIKAVPSVSSRQLVTHRPRPAQMKSKSDVVDEFQELVNMSADELEEWLQTPESNAVGMTNEGESEAQGHKSGRHIVELLNKSADSYTDEDEAHMRHVISYIKRHLAQKDRLGEASQEHLDSTKWAKSLKNWGHDPTKDA